MKKLITMLSIGLVGIVAQANIWNLNWSIGGAYSPDGEKALLEDYSVTWSLFNAADPSTPIYSMHADAGSDTIGMSDIENRVLSYDGYLIASSSVLWGETTLGVEQQVYQRIDISGPSGDFYWQGETHAVTPIAHATGEAVSIPATDMDDSIYIGSTLGDVVNTTWKSAVPEPATMSLLGLGALAMVLRRKLRK